MNMIVLLSVLLVLIILVANGRKALIAQRFLKLEEQYSPVFEDLIHRHVYRNPELYQLRVPYIDLPLNEFKSYGLTDRQIRKVLVKVILRCCEEFPGEKKRLLKKLYKDLDLDLYTIIELNLVNGEEYIESLKELMAMEVEVDSNKMKPFLASKNERIRTATRQYLRSMKSFTCDFALEEYELSGSAVSA